MKKKIQTTEKNVQKLTMKQLPKEDRPYEKCLTQGARFLTDEELLAVIIRTGSKDATSLELARSILALEGHGTRLLGLLHHSLKDYCRIKALEIVKGAQLMCIRNFPGASGIIRPKKPLLSFWQEQIAEYYMEDLRHLEQEEIHVMFLNTKQNLLHVIFGI